MAEKRVLIVDDEVDLREILEFNLENEGYNVTTASSGEEALEKITNLEPFDLILLDIMMEGISGLRVAEKLRKELNINTPIIFLTAKVTENDMLTGFSIGADDYITKPFSIKEVIARSRAVLKRSEQSNVQNAPQIMEFGSMTINTTECEVTIAGEIITLTRKEYEILYLLTSSIGRTFSRDEILSRVWKDESYVLERTVDVHIARLRKKLGDTGVSIVNRSGYGYSFKQTNTEK